MCVKNKEAYKRIQGENTKVLKGMIDKAFKEKKAKGGRVGLKRGTGLLNKKSDIQKIKENGSTFAPKPHVRRSASSIAFFVGA